NKVGDYEIYCKLCPKFMLLNLLYVTNFDIGCEWGKIAGRTRRQRFLAGGERSGERLILCLK
ncbi:hypothetical protein M2T75_31475, partial [Klebsiella pneumoniae]|nr:hypothetical protein [Klebsiella pneumoniae]